MFDALMVMRRTSHFESDHSKLEPRDFETEHLDSEGKPGLGSDRSCSALSPLRIANLASLSAKQTV